MDEIGLLNCLQETDIPSVSFTAANRELHIVVAGRYNQIGKATAYKSIRIHLVQLVLSLNKYWRLICI